MIRKSMASAAAGGVIAIITPAENSEKKWCSASVRSSSFS
jgi:hypothetical protein